MMFWIILISLGAVAAWFMVIPALRAKPVQNASRQALNVDIFNQRLQELEDDKAAGRVDDEDYQSLKVELERNFLADMSQMEGQNGLVAGRARWLLISLVVFLPVVSAVIYKNTGYQQPLVDWFETQENVEPLIDKLIAGELKPEDLQKVAMADFVYGLQRRAQVQQEDAQLWFMLGNTFMQVQSGNTGNQAQLLESADKALRRAYYLEPENVEYGLSYAQVLLAQNQGALDKESRKILNEIIQKNPDLPSAIMMLSMASYQSGDYQTAIDGWEHLLALGGQNPGYEKAQGILKRSISQAKVKLEQQQSAADAVALTFSIDLDPAVPEFEQGYLMVYAQAEQGPPMPLAIKKLTLPLQFPTEVTLTNKDAMMSSMQLSSFEKVKVTARISQSGLAAPQKGDWLGLANDISTKSVEKAEIRINQPVE